MPAVWNVMVGHFSHLMEETIVRHAKWEDIPRIHEVAIKNVQLAKGLKIMQQQMAVRSVLRVLMPVKQDLMTAMLVNLAIMQMRKVRSDASRVLRTGLWDSVDN